MQQLFAACTGDDMARHSRARNIVREDLPARGDHFVVSPVARGERARLVFFADDTSGRRLCVSSWDGSHTLFEARGGALDRVRPKSGDTDGGAAYAGTFADCVWDAESGTAALFDCRAVCGNDVGRMRGGYTARMATLRALVTRLGGGARCGLPRACGTPIRLCDGDPYEAHAGHIAPDGDTGAATAGESVADAGDGDEMRGTVRLRSSAAAAAVVCLSTSFGKPCSGVPRAYGTVVARIGAEATSVRIVVVPLYNVRVARDVLRCAGEFPFVARGIALTRTVLPYGEHPILFDTGGPRVDMMSIPELGVGAAATDTPAPYVSDGSARADPPFAAYDPSAGQHVYFARVSFRRYEAVRGASAASAAAAAAPTEGASGSDRRRDDFVPRAGDVWECAADPRGHWHAVRRRPNRRVADTLYVCANAASYAVSPHRVNLSDFS